MVTTEKIIKWLTGPQHCQELVMYLENNFKSFLPVKSRYLEALEQFRKELGNDVSPSVDDLVDAIESQTASTLFYSGVLGFKNNWDHFVDPMARTVLDVDFEVYLSESTARRFPKYRQAQAVIDSFCALLAPQQKESYESIIEYISYLETVGPKMAHYYGYVLGNDILYDLVPGYYPDKVLTMQYRLMLARYLGQRP